MAGGDEGEAGIGVLVLGKFLDTNYGTYRTGSDDATERNLKVAVTVCDSHAFCGKRFRWE